MKCFEKMEKVWEAFEALLKTKYTTKITDIAEETGAPYIGPTLEQFQTLVIFGRTVCQHDPEFGNIPIKEIAAADIQELDDVKIAWKFVKLSQRLKHMKRNAVIANAVTLVTGKADYVVKKIKDRWSDRSITNVQTGEEVTIEMARLGPRRNDLTEGELEELIPQEVPEVVKQGRWWRNAWDYEAKKPGFLLKFAKWSFKYCQGVEMSANVLKTLAKGKFAFGALFKAGALGMDIWSLVKAHERIKKGSWSEAALELKKQHIQVEAQVNELLKFRASLDSSFANDFFLLRVGDKYLSGPAADAGKLEFKDLGEVNMGILDPNLQFMGLSKTNGRYDLWRHHLTGGYINIIQASLSNQVCDDMKRLSFLS